MSQHLSLKARGRFTSYNDLGSVPEGALLIADDVDISNEGIIEPRRGFQRHATYSDSSDRTSKLFHFDNKLFSHHGNYLSEDTLSYYNGSSWTVVSASFLAPTSTKIKWAFSNENIYLTSSTGVKVLSDYTGSLRSVGAPKGLELTAATTGSTGFLANTYSVNYRIVWAYRDSNDNLILGAPSQALSFTNSAGGSRDVNVTTTIPDGITTSWIYQLYRSNTSSTTPSDNLFLVFEGSPTGGEITAKSVTIPDITPDALVGAALYTNANQEGLVNSNLTPPLAKDLAVFDNCLFYANTTSKQQNKMTILATGASSGIQVNDTITISGVVFTAKSSETIGSGYFKVFTGGSVEDDIYDTALSLVKVINQYSSSTVYAYYDSSEESGDKPGRILIEERTIGGNAFVISVSRTSSWSYQSLTSSNDFNQNMLRWSKPNQPEAVPAGHYKAVGSKSSAILRIIPLKEALLIFKEDGIYRLTGFFPNFNIELMDTSAKLIGPETPAILNNTVFCLTDQGIVSVSDAVRVVSRPIETDILQVFGRDLDLVKDVAFGVGYESDRKYMLFMPDVATDTYPVYAHVFNVFTQAFTRYVLNKTTGIVADNALYLADADGAYVSKERKTYTFSDYGDTGVSTTISAQADELLTIGSNIDLINLGDVVWQDDDTFASVTDIDLVNSQITVDANPGFSIAAATIITGIPTNVQYAPITLQNPAVIKSFHTATLLFQDDFYGTGYVTFSSDLSAGTTEVPIEGNGLALWGLFAWGEDAWGGNITRRPARQWVPRNYQSSGQLIVGWTHSYAYSPWKLTGISLFGEPGSEKINR